MSSWLRPVNIDHQSRMPLCLVFIVATQIFSMFLGPVAALAQEFTKATPGYEWSFPSDFGAHLSYESEWWYYTGQLYDESSTPFADKPLFGFQLTFFRKGVVRTGRILQDYMAHAAISDIASGRTLFEARLGGGPLGLAGIGQLSHTAWSGDWRVDAEPDGSLTLHYSLFDNTAGVWRAMSITAKNLPPPWLQGTGGFSKKGECDRCASMYYSLPRIQLRAQYSDGNSKSALRGLGWMDHEFMTNSLAPSQEGWDWLALMLKDGRSLMIFRVRDSAGRPKDFVSGAVHDGGMSASLSAAECTLETLSTWRSPRTGATYPVEWRVTVPSHGINATVRARIDDSEIGATHRGKEDAGQHNNVGVAYWEGPVASADESVIGYLEMTGYAGKVVL